MRSKQPRVKSNAADPLGDETGILTGGHTAVGTAAAGEQELSGSFVGGGAGLMEAWHVLGCEEPDTATANSPTPLD
jgi:hypothetical protein